MAPVSRPVRTLSWIPLALLVCATLAGLAGAPGAAQPESALVLIGDHELTIVRGPDGATTVVERMFLTSDAPYSGEVWVDLHPAAERITHSFERADRTPLGLAGQVSREPLPNETVGDHVRYRIDLEARNVTIATDEVVVLRLTYILPGEVMSFTRGFTLETPSLAGFVVTPHGFLPVRNGTPFPSIGVAWSFALPAAAQGPYAPGERFAFDIEEHPVPLEPLAVLVRSAGDDPVILTATGMGGIPPYSYRWDLSGNGECDDAEGASVQVPVSAPGTHEATVCVTDSAVPMGETEWTYESRTAIVDGNWDGPSPWLLLLFGLLVGGLLIFGLSRTGVLPTPTGRAQGGRDGATTFGVESRGLLETRQRVMVAALKELEVARKKGEVGDDVYTPLKAELKRDTVRVMREIERRKGETV